MPTLQHRLTIPGIGSSFAPGDPDPLPDTDFYITSKRRTDHPWIAQAGEDSEAGPDITMDGQHLDVLTGHVEDGEIQFRVIDVPAPITAVACDITSILIPEGASGVHLDATAFSSLKWVAESNWLPGEPPQNGMGANAAGILFSTFALFNWFPFSGGPWVRWAAAKSIFDGTEDGGPAWTPGQKVGFRFRVNWTLDTGGGNAFVEVEDADGTHRVSGPTPSFDFWSIPVDPLNNQVDLTVYAVADASGEVIVRVGAENMFPSMNITVGFTDLAVVECEDVVVSVDAERYVTGWLADADARQQLRGRKAYLEESTDAGVTWSRVVFVGFVNDIVLEQSLTYVFTIGDARRVQRVTRAWADLNPAGSALQAKMTALIGGPIAGGWSPIVPHYGYPVFTVTNQQAATLGANGWVELQYTSGPLPPMWAQPSGGSRRRNGILKIAANVINERAEPFHDGTPTAGELGGTYPGLRATLLNANTEATVLGDLTPLSFHIPDAGFATPFLGIFGLDRPVLFTANRTLRLQWSVTSTGTHPNGTRFKLLVTPRDISEQWPLHIGLHPVVLTAFLYDQIGEAYDLTSANATKALVGDHRVAVLRLTDPNQTIQDINEVLFGRYQYGTRRGNDGEWEFFSYGKIDSTPGDDLSDAVLREEGGPTHEHGDVLAVNQVVIRSKLFSEWTDDDGTEPPFDNLVERDAPATFQLAVSGTPDADHYGLMEQVYELPGYDGFYTDLSPMGLKQSGAWLAESIFDRHGRGAVQNTFVCLRDTDADNAVVGAPVIISPDHLPNAQLGQTPTSQRGGSRWARVIQRTEETTGPIVTVVDDSTGVQYAEVIGLAVTPSATADPRYFYDLELTDITQSQLDAARIEVQFALGASVPTGGNPYTMLDASLFVDNASAVVDPWTETLGPFVPGQTVWFRVRARLYGGRPGAWSAWCHIGGCATGPQTTLSDLVISNFTDDGADLDWSYDESPQVGDVLVQYRETLVGGAYTTFSTLAPGTETEMLTGLDPATQYDVRIVLDDSGEYGDILLGTFWTLSGSISGLTLGTPTTDGVALSWTNTNSNALVRVQVKLDTESNYVTVVDLPAGSTDYTLTGLIPETDYDVRVVLVLGGSEIGTALTDSFTTDLNANQTQLDAPTSAAVWEGANPNTGDPTPGMYALEVMAVFGPPGMAIVFEEAVETSVGSGTPGSYTVVATMPAVVGDFTRYVATAPNDSLLRYLKAYAQASGYLDSDPTSVLSADPWPATPTVPDPPSLTIGGMVPTHILPGESFTVPVRRQALFTVPIDNEGILLIDGVLEAVD